MTSTSVTEGIRVEAMHQEKWGLASFVGIPGGGKIGLYERTHPTPSIPKDSRNKKKPKGDSVWQIKSSI